MEKKILKSVVMVFAISALIGSIPRITGAQVQNLKLGFS